LERKSTITPLFRPSRFPDLIVRIAGDFGVVLSVWGRQCDDAISSKVIAVSWMWTLAAHGLQSMPMPMVIGYGSPVDDKGG
jgi:hypothetical protein